MTLPTLQQTLSDALSGSQFTFPTNLFSQSAFATGLDQLVSQGNLVLQGCKQTADSTSVTLTGNYASSLFGNSPVTCSAVFTISNAQPACTLTFEGFDTGWNLAQLFPALKGTLFADVTWSDVKLTLSTDPGAGIPSDFAAQWSSDSTTSLPATGTLVGGLSFSGNVNVKDLPTTVATSFSSTGATSFALAGEIALQSVTNGTTTHYLPVIWFKAQEVGKISLLGQTLSADLSVVALVTETTGQAPSVEAFFALSGTLSLSVSGQSVSFPIEARFSTTSTPTISFTSKSTGTTSYSLEDAGALIGLGSLSGLVPSSFPALSNLSVSAISYSLGAQTGKLISAGLTLSTPSSWSWSAFDNLFILSQPSLSLSATTSPGSDTWNLALSMQGHVSLYGVALDATLNLPSESLTLSLPAGKTLDLTQWLTPIMGSDQVPSSGVTCTRFNLSANVSANQYACSATLKNDWTFSLDGTDTTLSEVQLQLQDAAGTKQLSLIGDVSIGSVTATASLGYQSGHWSFAINQKTGQIPVGSFVQDLAHLVSGGLTVPEAVSSLDMSQFTFTYDGATQTTSGSLTLAEGQTVKVGSYSLTATLTGSFQHTPQDTSNAVTFSGQWQIGKEAFTLAISEQGGNTSFSAEWEGTDGATIGFEDLADALGIEHDLTVPSSLSLGLTSVAVIYAASADQFVISAATASGDAFFFTEKNSSGDTVFVMGVTWPSTHTLSDIPGLGSTLKAADSLSFDDVQLYLASGSLSSVKLPTLPALPGNKQVQVASLPSGSITQGMSISGSIDLGSSSNTILKHAASLVKEDTLNLSVTWGESNDTMKAACSLPGGAQIPTGSGAITIDSCSFYFQITEDAVTANVDGEWSFPLFGQTIDTTLRITVSEDEADVAIDLKDPNGAFPSPPGIKGLHLEDIGLELGIEFEPPSVEFGISGKAQIGTSSSDQNSFSLVLAFDADVPNPLYLSFDLSELDISEAITLFTDESSSSDWDFLKAENVSFYWCETPQTLPNGLVTQPGFGFGATVDLLSFSAYGNLQINQASGIRGQFQCAPISLGSLFSLTGNGSTVQQKQNGKTVTVIPAGGPVFDFNSAAV